MVEFFQAFQAQQLIGQLLTSMHLLSTEWKRIFIQYQTKEFILPSFTIMMVITDTFYTLGYSL